MKALLRDLLKRAFPWWFAEYPVSLATKLEVVDPWPDPPADNAPSCFIKGLAVSLTEHPEEWPATPSGTSRRDGWWPYPVLDVTHVTTQVRVVACGPNERSLERALPGCTRISGIILYNPTSWAPLPLEAEYIAQALEARPFGRLKRLIDADHEEAERKAKANAHFSSLGCPPTASTTLSSQP